MPDCSVILAGLQQIQSTCFLPSTLLNKKVQKSINIALKKVSGQPLTASQVRNLDNRTMQHLIFLDQAYYFMKNIPGSPAYWKNFLFEVVVMIKQLAPHAWWITFSCADLRCKEIYKILSKLKGHEMSDTAMEQMTYDEKCKMLNSNPVVVAKHFQYRSECLFSDVLLGSGNPVGKLLYHAIRIEFQFRGSPHPLCFVWIKDCPVLSDETFDMSTKFIDKHVSAFLPDPVTCPVLHDLVKTYQTHAHLKLVENTRIYHADSILVIFLLREQLLQDHYQKP